jgi:signal peptidase II
MSEPARADAPQPARAPLEVRVGSATNALQPIPGAARSLAAGSAQWIELAVVAVAAAAADQLTKAIVSSQLALGDAVEIVGPFSIHHVRNTGIAFGLFSGATSIVIVLTSLAIGALVAFFARSARRHPLLPVAVGLVLGGSISNLVDRLRLGHVTDFLDLDYWPAFNLADTFIVVGVGLLFLSFVAADRSSARVGTSPLSRS